MRVPSLALLVASLFVLVSACGAPTPTHIHHPASPPPAEGYAAITGSISVDTDRPVDVFVPTGYDGKTALPFVLLLHGYGATGALMDSYTHFHDFANANHLVYAHPEGKVDSSGKQFWNATGTCCDFAGTGVDDSAYLARVVDEARAQVNIDPARIFIIGHSNGGFMAQRMACDHADVFAAVVSLSGATDLTPGKCVPSEPIAVLEVHGTADSTIEYAGGAFQAGAPTYPSAEETGGAWASRNSCDPTAFKARGALDIDTLSGAETTVEEWQGCAPGGAAALWTSHGGQHVPNPNAHYLPALFHFLTLHAR